MLSKKIVPPFLIFLIPFFLILVWFSKGLIFGGGEAGIPFYNITPFLNTYKHAWADGFFGNSTSWVIANIPLFWFFSILEKLGIPNFLNQALFFFLVFFISGIGVYLLVKDSFDSKIIAQISILFYWFNFASMILIWNRFQYPYMSLYALLPITLYVFKKGLEQKKIIYALFTNFVLLLASITFISIPTLELYFGVLFLYLLFFLALKKFRLQEILFSLFYFFSLIVVWIAFNAWWLFPFLSTLFSTSYITQVAYTPTGDLDTLSALSERLGNLSYVLRLMHRDFFINMKEVWGSFYQNPLIIILSFLVPFFVFAGFLIKKKPRDYYFFILLFLIAVFFAKGIVSPFGGFFEFLFTHIRFLEAFRNPFEKIGIILPLAYAPLFGFGIYNFYLWLETKKKKYAKSITGLLLILIYGILMWPIWTGWVFTSTEPPTNIPSIGDRVEVPSYYSLANSWLNQDKNNFRVIVLPMSGEGITYKWGYGYNGVELSNTLFTKPFISACTTIDYLCPIANSFEQLLLKYPNDFWKALPSLNAKYVMVRNDIDWKLRDMQNPADIKEILDKKIANIAFEKQFDKLNFYKLNDAEFTPKIFATDKGIYFGSDSNDSFISALQAADYKKGDIYFTDSKKTNVELPNTKQIIVKAQEFPYNNLKVSKVNALQELPYVRFLPDSLFYPLIRLKEKIGLFLAGNSSFPQVLEYSDKRIVETFRLVGKGEYSLANKTLKEYLKDLKDIQAKRQDITETNFKEDLLRQRYVLTDAIKILENKNISTDQYRKALNFLDKLLYEIKLSPLFLTNLKSFRSYSFFIPEDGFYNLILDIKDFPKFFKGNDLEIIIDGKNKEEIKIKKEGKQIPFSYYFTVGNQQIDILLPQEFNLISQNSDFTLETMRGVRKSSFEISPYSPSGRYKISLDYLAEEGNLPAVYLTQDTDLVKKGKPVPKINFSPKLKMDNYYHSWRHLEEVFSPDPVSHKARVIFEVRPWNNCEELNPGFLKGRCKIKNFYESFNKETIVRVKNLKVKRDDLGSLILVKNRNQTATFNPPYVSYQEINPAVYRVSVRNATAPFLLAFLESYHPLWRAYILDKNGNKKEIAKKNHLLINSFANAWYIDKLGTYHLLLEFYPEELFILGKKISLAAFGISFLILFFAFIKRRLIKK